MREVYKRAHTEYLTIFVTSHPLYIASLIHLKRLKKKKVSRKRIKREKLESLRRAARFFWKIQLRPH